MQHYSTPRVKSDINATTDCGLELYPFVNLNLILALWSSFWLLAGLPE